MQFICTSTAKGHLHILRPAWVITVLCSNPSYYTGHRTSLCNTLHTAICTALGREKLLVPSSPPSKNCQVSISSAINFSEKQVLSSFLLPSSFSSLFKSTRVGTVEVQSCVVLSWDLCAGMLKSWDRLKDSVRLPFPVCFLLGMQHRDSKGMVSKTIMATYKLSLRRTWVLQVDWLLFMFTSVFSFTFPKKNNIISKIS